MGAAPYNATHMMPKPPLPAAPRPVDALDHELCLMGATRMSDFIDFVRERAIGGRDMDRGDLAQMWRDASAVFDELQTTEAGAADKPQILPLPKALAAHAAKLVKLPSFQQTFSAVPVAFGMVELDKLIVSQQHIGRASVDRMVASLAEAGVRCRPGRRVPAADGCQRGVQGGSPGRRTLCFHIRHA